MEDVPEREETTPGESDVSEADSGTDGAEAPVAADDAGTDTGSPWADDDADLEELRERVEAEYDFEDFGAGDMAEMEPAEWEAAFDADTWITGEELLDRVQADLEHRVATRDVFAVVERATHDGAPCVLAYTDSSYALVEPDGSVEGFGTVLRDTKPVVALCSMESYEVPEPPEADHLLPHPEEVPTGSGELGNLMIQVVAGTHLLAGAVLLLVGLYIAATNLVGAPAVGVVAGASGTAATVTIVVGVVFALVGIALFATVANARLSDAFRAEEYRERLRQMGLDDGERPEFLPVDAGARELTDEDRGES